MFRRSLHVVEMISVASSATTVYKTAVELKGPGNFWLVKEEIKLAGQLFIWMVGLLIFDELHISALKVLLSP